MTEIEIKLRLLPGADEALRRCARLAAAVAEERQETTRYFDTPDCALQAQGMTLRVRSGGGRFVQTLKTAASGGGAASARGEWEWTIDGDAPTLDSLAGTPAAPLVPALDGALIPVLVTDIHRTARTLRLADGTEIETAHDRGSISAGAARQAVDELELELKQGSLAALYRLAIELHGSVPMYLAPESKSARGYRLLSGAAPSACRAPTLALDRSVPANEAFRAIAAAELGAILGNVAAVEEAGPEGIHQMRVGLRRLRAALALFAPMLEPRAAGLLAAELRRLEQVFGARRDRDVLCLDSLPAFARDGESVWADMLLTRSEEDRASHLAPVLAALRGPGLTGLALGLAAWCEGATATPALLGPGDWAEKLATVAPALLDRLAERVARRAKCPDRLHDLRKSLKKLRYATEFVAGLYDADAVQTYRGRCADLQETLAIIVDARVAPALAANLAAADDLRLVPAVAALAGWCAAREQTALRGLDASLAAFRAAEPFWRVA